MNKANSWVPPMPSRWPKEAGIVLEQHGKTAICEERFEEIDNLFSWLYQHGTVLSDCIKLVVDKYGNSKILATRFIPCSAIVLQVSSNLDVSYDLLLQDIAPIKKWIDLLRVKRDLFLDSRSTVARFHIEETSNNLEFAVVMIGVIQKLRHTEARVFTTSLFEKYLNSLPKDIESLMFSWSPEDLAVISNTSFHRNCNDNVKRLVLELFEEVVLPFANQWPALFVDPIDFELFVRVLSIIQSRGFVGDKFHPVIDLMNGLPVQQHNCATYSTLLDAHRVQIAQTTRDIQAGEEVLLSYAQKGNGEYLSTYGYLPLHREVVLNNPCSTVYLNFGQFIQQELLKAYPSSGSIRTQVSTFIKETVRIPDLMGLHLESIVSDLRYVETLKGCLSILLVDEKCWARQNISEVEAARTSRPDAVIRLFVKLLEGNITVIPMASLRTILQQCRAVRMDKKEERSREEYNRANRLLSSVLLYIAEMRIVDIMCMNMANSFPPGFLPVALYLMGHLMYNDDLTLLLDEHLALESSSSSSQVSSVIKTSACLTCATCGAKNRSCMKCSRCKLVYYCDANCQRKHWNQHKRLCVPKR
jgi:hypothetical protein